MRLHLSGTFPNPNKAKAIVKAIAKLTEHLTKDGLNLTTLETIIVTDNFNKDLEKVRLDYNLSPNPNSKAKGITLRTLTGQLRQTILIKSDLFNDILHGIHILHHELGHINDNYHHNINIQPTDQLFLVETKSYWSEYFAMRYSVNTSTTPLVNIWMNALEGVSTSYKNTANEIRNNPTLMQNREKQSRLFSITYDYFTILFSTLGYLDGMRNTPRINSIPRTKDFKAESLALQAKLNSTAKVIMSESNFVRLQDELTHMYNAFPHEDHEDMVDDLAFIVETIWKELISNKG